MSTRCQIKIVANGMQVHLYHHCDGYFSGVGEEISKSLSKFKDYIIRKAPWVANDFIDDLWKNGGYEITMTPHGDIEFFYLVDFDQMVFEGYIVAGSDMWEDSEDCIGRWKKNMNPIQSQKYTEKMDLLK